MDSRERALQLTVTKRLQVVDTTQQAQREQRAERCDGENRAICHSEERTHERKTPVHGLEKFIECPGNNDITRRDYDVDCDTESEQALGSDNVTGSGSRITLNDEAVKHKHLGEDRQRHGRQEYDSCETRIKQWRSLDSRRWHRFPPRSKYLREFYLAGNACTANIV